MKFIYLTLSVAAVLILGASPTNAITCTNTFPTSLNSYVAGTCIPSAWANAIEAKLGITQSASTTSVDYLLNRIFTSYQSDIIKATSTQGLLQTLNNLSDLLSTSTARSNLGLGASSSDALVYASSVQAAIYDTGGFGFHAKAYGAKCDGAGDDSPGYRAAEAVAAINGGKVLAVPGICVVSSSIPMTSNTYIEAQYQGATVFKTSMPFTAGYGIFTVSSATNVGFYNLSFQLNSEVAAIADFGSTNLTVENSYFTGTGTLTKGAIGLIGASANGGVSNFENTAIRSNTFFNMPSSSVVIYLYAQDGHTITATKILNNHFKLVGGPVIHQDDLYPIIGTIIDGNSFLDIIGGPNTTNNPAVALTMGLGDTPNNNIGTMFTHNYYKNTLTTSTYPNQRNEGVVFFYASVATTISDNIMIGSWSSSTVTAGPALAPGRTTTPDYGTIIAHNYIQGFDSCWDPDSMVGATVTNNTCANDGAPFDVGYNTQKDVNVIGNTFYDSPETYNGIRAFMKMDCANPIGGSLSHNTYFDDSQTTGTLYVANFVCGTDDSSLAFKDNSFYSASSSIPITSLFVTNGGASTYPTNVSGNSVQSPSGTVADLSGIYPQLATTNIFTGLNIFLSTASSTVKIGSSTSPGCLEMGSASGTAKLIYVWFDTNAAIFTTTTKPSFCQ